MEPGFEILKKAQLFTSLDYEEFQNIFEHSQEIDLHKGESIFHDGEKASALYVVLDGEITIHRVGLEGNEVILAQLISGETFGEQELFTFQPRNAEAFASLKSKILRIPREGEDIEVLMEKYPGIASKILNTFLKVIAGRIRKANILLKENSSVAQELKRQVYGDKLTGLYNKTYLEETLPTQLKTSPLTLILMKPDNFKQINDTFGHEAGDGALKLMSRELNQFVGDSGFALRYMGNELGVVWPNTDLEPGLEKTRQIIRIFQQMDLSPFVGNSGLKLSMSAGLVVYPTHGSTASELIEKAHELPLLGRSKGGNLILLPNQKGEYKL